MPKNIFAAHKTISISIALICTTIIFIFLIALEIYSLNETITDGNGYGYQIGLSKKETFLLAKKNYKSKVVYFTYGSNGRINQPLKQIEFSNNDLKVLEKSNTWYFHFGNPSMDRITFNFENDALKKIFRYRMLFDFIT